MSSKSLTPETGAPRQVVPRIRFDAPPWPLVFELDEGQSVDIPGAGGRKHAVRLMDVAHFTEPDWWVPENPAHATIACAEVSIEVDGEPVRLLCRPYEMPREVRGLRLYVEATRDWARTSHYQPLANIAGCVRFSCVPAGASWGPALRFPLAGYRWRTSTYRNTWNSLVPFNSLYYHRGEDMGAIPDRLDIVAPAAGRIALTPLPEGDNRSNSLAIDLDGSPARLTFAHMNIESIPASLTAGAALPVGGKIGRTGCTWSGSKSQHDDPHLHLGLRLGELDLSPYPLLVESYFSTYDDPVVAVAGGFAFTTAGGSCTCDGSRSLARPGRRIVRWQWRLHDGREVEGPLAQAVYDRAGVYVEELIVMADDGSRDRDFLHVRAYNPGQLRGIARGWLYSSPCRGILPGTPVTLWTRLSGAQEMTVDFGDKTDPVLMQPELQHVYAAPGLYAVTVSGRGPGDEPVTLKLRVRVEGK